MIKSLSGNKNVKGFGVIGVSRLTRTNSKWQRLDLNQRLRLMKASLDIDTESLPQIIVFCF